MKKSTISNSDFALAREFEKYGITTISQAVKAFERGETTKINEWNKLLVDKKNASN